ncbi:MAG: cobalamin biosynthesis protein, partial [Methylocystis sp.]
MLAALFAHLPLALLALAFEGAFGYPRALLARIGHPVVRIGAAISALEARLNEGPPVARRVRGVAALAALLTGSLALG